MITIFCGSDREKISSEVHKLLGEGYEVFEGENLKMPDLVNILKGRTLFSDKRKILIRDLTPSRKDEGEKTEASGVDFYAEMAKYADTKHEVVIWESQVSRKKSYKEFLKLPGVTEKRFDLAKPVDAGRVFDIYDLALRDGEKAISELRKIEEENDPYMFFGLLASQAIKKYEYRRGASEKRALKELAELDMQMKTTSIDPWRLIEAFLLRLKTI